MREQTTFWDILTFLAIAYAVVHLTIAIFRAVTAKTSYRGPKEMNNFGTHFGKALFQNKTFLLAFIITGILMVAAILIYGI